jgi:hypothetical protein
MNDPLRVYERPPNEERAVPGHKKYLQNTYGPQHQKTFVGALEAFFAQEFPQLAGDRARRAIVAGINDMVQQFFPATTHLHSGQTTWVSVAKNETSSYGKPITKTRLVPVIISLLTDEERQRRMNGTTLQIIKRDAVARICHETDQQGGCITAAELALIFKTTPNTIGKYIAHWQTEHNQLLPRRGTIHDIGPTLTHKKHICKLLFLDKKTVAETARITHHSPQAIHRYITNFRQVFICTQNKLHLNDIATATKLSTRLIHEYQKLFQEYAVNNDAFATLLNNNTTK